MSMQNLAVLLEPQIILILALCAYTLALTDYWMMRGLLPWIDEHLDARYGRTL